MVSSGVVVIDTLGRLIDRLGRLVAFDIDDSVERT